MFYLVKFSKFSKISPQNLDFFIDRRRFIDADTVYSFVNFQFCNFQRNRNFGLNDLYEAWVDENHHNAERPRFNYVFAICGLIPGHGAADNIEVLLTKNTRSNYQLDISTQKWKKMNTILGQNRAHHGSVVLNNQVYIFGGGEHNEEPRDYCRELFVFNPNTKGWDYLSQMVEKKPILKLKFT